MKQANQESVQMLEELRKRGFHYLRTFDDGETWRGTNSYGLKIDTLLEAGNFQGRIVVSDHDSCFIWVRRDAVPTSN